MLAPTHKRIERTRAQTTFVHNKKKSTFDGFTFFPFSRWPRGARRGVMRNATREIAMMARGRGAGLAALLLLRIDMTSAPWVDVEPVETFAAADPLGWTCQYAYATCGGCGCGNGGVTQVGGVSPAREEARRDPRAGRAKYFAAQHRLGDRIPRVLDGPTAGPPPPPSARPPPPPPLPPSSPPYAPATFTVVINVRLDGSANVSTEALGAAVIMAIMDALQPAARNSTSVRVTLNDSAIAQATVA